MARLIEDLSRDRELIETHISWVLLGENDVLKLKKPVDLGFLDFSTLEKRHTACDSELVLNRRLCRDTYRAVVPITRDATGSHHVNGPGEVVDFAVQMRRLADDQRADNLLHAGRLTRDHIGRIASRLARFHDGAARSAHIDSFGDVAVIRRNVLENFEQTRQLAPKHITPEQAAQIESAQLGFLDQHTELFERRISLGRIRDGHGDLRLEHVYFAESGLDIIDCIEFNERFRYADVCADVAFLSMDLRHQGRPDLAECLLGRYAEQSGDYDLYALVDFYEAYRAYVRAKVVSFTHEAPDIPPSVRERAHQAARAFYLHALASQHQGLERPALVAVGGLIASGKTTTTQRLTALLDCPSVDTDRTRKQLLGRDELTPIHSAAFGGAYDETFTERVYDEVFRRAEVVLGSGRSVVVDASFRSAKDRARILSSAKRCGVTSYFVHCHVPRQVALTRLEDRAKAASVSDGRAEIYDSFAQRWQPPQGDDAHHFAEIDTTLPEAEVIRCLRELLELDPEK